MTGQDAGQNTAQQEDLDKRGVALLSAMDDLVARLRRAGEPRWAEWIEADRGRIAAGDGQGVDHFLSAFGGSGSLNDIPGDAETRTLCSRCWSLARDIQRERDR
jgi:hypothetical protein